MDRGQMEKSLSFSLLGREEIGDEQPPRNHSRIFAVNGHQVVVNGSRLFIDGEFKIGSVVYASKASNKILALTEHAEIVSYCFDTQKVRRYTAERRVAGCKERNGYMGVLYEDSTLRIYKEGRCINVKENVRDFELPECILGLDGKYAGYEDVERIFRDGDERIVVVGRSKIRCGEAEIENVLHGGDFDYAMGYPPQYYRCSFKNVQILVSSNSSQFVLLTEDLRELELEEEMKVLALRTDDDFRTRYLSGMDYWGGCVYLLDDGGVVTRFKVDGVGDLGEETSEAKMDFVLDGVYCIRDDKIEEVKDKGDAVQASGKETAVEKDRLFGREERPGAEAAGASGQKKDKPASPSAFSMKELMASAERDSKTSASGNLKLDKLLDSLKDQAEDLIRDFKSLEIKKGTFHLYKHNSNDLHALIEQMYKNIMRLENHREMEKDLEFQSNYILQTIETLKGMNEENIKSSIRYIDNAISSKGKGRRRRPVHYTRPLHCSIDKAKAVETCSRMSGAGVEETLREIGAVEQPLNEKGREGPQVGSVLRAAEPSVEEAVRGQASKEQEAAAPDGTGTAPSMETQPIRQEAASPLEAASAFAQPSWEAPQTDIFGKPMSQQQPEFISGIFKTPSSSIFQTITGNPKFNVPAPLPRDEKKDENEPNAFSRFANTRSMFR
jgi:hypothetical protein